MTATLDGATKGKREPTAEERAAEEQGLSLASPDGLLRQLTKTVRETALKREIPSISVITSTARRQAIVGGQGPTVLAACLPVVPDRPHVPGRLQRRLATGPRPA